MALKQIRIGSLPDIIQYDDGDYDEAIDTDAPIKAGAPTDPDHVIRQTDAPGAGDEGDVVGPAGATDEAIALYNGVTGKLIKDSLMTVSATGTTNIPTGQGHKVNNIQVVTDQQAAEADITSGAITDPADAPADADALRDDLVANALSEIGANFSALDTKINNILAKLRTHGLINT